MLKKHGIVAVFLISLLALLPACSGESPVSNIGYGDIASGNIASGAPGHSKMGKPSVPIVVNVSHTEADGQITVTAKAKVMTDVYQATFNIMHPDEVDLVAGSASWVGDLQKDGELVLTATYKVVRPVVVYPLSWRALFSAQAGGLSMSMHGYTHYGNGTILKSLSNKNGPEVRAGSIEYKGQ